VAVESSGSDDRAVEGIEVVGRGHHDEVGLCTRPLERGDERAENRLLLEVVGFTALRDRIELVEEQQRRSVRAREREEIVDVARTFGTRRADEIGSTDRDQREPELTGGRTREERLADTGRPVQQDAVPRDVVLRGFFGMAEHDIEGVA